VKRTFVETFNLKGRTERNQINVKNLKIILKIENDSEIELNLSITKRRDILIN
jgi:hypothetical protein